MRKKGGKKLITHCDLIHRVYTRNFFNSNGKTGAILDSGNWEVRETLNPEKKHHNSDRIVQDVKLYRRSKSRFKNLLNWPKDI